MHYSWLVKNRLFYLLFALLLLVSCSVFPILPTPEQRICSAADLNSTSATWRIAEGSANARILWQRVAETPFLARFYASYAPNSGFAASNQTFVLLWEDLCGSETELIAYDIKTGQEVWRLPPPPDVINYAALLAPSYASVFRSVTPLSDGYALVSVDHWLFRFNTIGELMWANSQLPSRSVRRIYGSENYLYIPALTTNPEGYIIDLQNGHLAETVDIPNLLAFYDDVAIVGDPCQCSISVFNWSTQEVLASIQVPNPELVSSALSAPSLQLLSRFEDVLLLYNDFYRPTHIQAYDVRTGQFLWELSKPLETFPVESNHRLIAFTASSVEIYDLRTGVFLSRVTLTDGGSVQAEVPVENRVWLAAQQDIVLINFRSQGDMVALEIPALK
jgi:hypothetical protein